MAEESALVRGVEGEGDDLYQSVNIYRFFSEEDEVIEGLWRGLLN